MRIVHSSLLLLLIALPTAHAIGQVGGAGTMPEGPNPKNIPTRMDDLVNFTQRDAADRAVKLSRAGGRARPAKPNEIVTGASVADDRGVSVGSIAGVQADGAIVQTPSGKVKLPLDAFGMNKAGLLIGMSKGDFERLVAHAVAG